MNKEESREYRSNENVEEKKTFLSLAITNGIVTETNYSCRSSPGGARIKPWPVLDSWKSLQTQQQSQHPSVSLQPTLSPISCYKGLAAGQALEPALCQSSPRHESIKGIRRRQVVDSYKNQEALLPQNYSPRDEDIIFGKTRLAYKHIGNQRFRITIGAHVQEYIDKKDRSYRTELILRIMETIRQEGGRFLKYRHERWVDVGDRIARSKVGHALRDLAASSYRLKPSESTTSSLGGMDLDENHGIMLCSSSKQLPIVRIDSHLKQSQALTERNATMTKEETRNTHVSVHQSRAKSDESYSNDSNLFIVETTSNPVQSSYEMVDQESISSNLDEVKTTNECFLNEQKAAFSKKIKSRKVLHSSSDTEKQSSSYTEMQKIPLESSSGDENRFQLRSGEPVPFPLSFQATLSPMSPIIGTLLIGDDFVAEPNSEHGFVGSESPPTAQELTEHLCSIS